MNFQKQDEIAKKTRAWDLVGLLLFIPVLLLRGWILSILWGWFISPALSIPVPSIPICLGLTLIGPMFVGTTALQHKSPKSLIETILDSIVGSLFALGIGWIIHLFA